MACWIRFFLFIVFVHFLYFILSYSFHISSLFCVFPVHAFTSILLLNTTMDIHCAPPCLLCLVYARFVYRMGRFSIRGQLHKFSISSGGDGIYVEMALIGCFLLQNWVIRLHGRCWKRFHKKMFFHGIR